MESVLNVSVENAFMIRHNSNVLLSTLKLSALLMLQQNKTIQFIFLTHSTISHMCTQASNKNDIYFPFVTFATLPDI